MKTIQNRDIFAQLPFGNLSKRAGRMFGLSSGRLTAEESRPR